MNDSFDIISPIDGSIYQTVPVMTFEEGFTSYQRAYEAQGQLSRMTLAERQIGCQAFVQALLAEESQLCEALTWQMGRPIAQTAGELSGFKFRAQSMIDMATTALAPTFFDDKDHRYRSIMKEPKGVVLVIAPWNYPYLTAVNSIVPAILAGNSVVLKHARQTALVGEALQRAAERSGLPMGALQSIQLSHEDIARQMSGGLYQHVVLTGSMRAGREVMKHATSSLTLELGGKDAAYVRSDADINHAAIELASGAMYNSGQSCCGIERIYVHASKYEHFLEALKAEVMTYQLGDPRKTTTNLGPMASEAGALKVADMIEQAIADGAEAICERFEHAFPTAAYLAPQILTNVQHHMLFMQEEVFGPVVGVMPVEDDDEALSLINDSRYGLTASIWTADVAVAQQLGRDIQAGTIFMNRCDVLDPMLPWTGLKDSGQGVSLSAHGFDAFVQLKGFNFKTIG